MRIISGKLGGRNFDAPKGRRTHPMSEKARGGLFSALGDISDLTVLDAFAGSGALAYEAISRGAKSVVAIDVDKNAVQTIKYNLRALIISDVKPIRANASGWSDKNIDAEFDLVFACPPYDDLQLSVVEKLVRHTINGGIFVLDWPKGVKVPHFDTLEKLKEKNYGDANLVFYRKIR